MRCIHCKDDNDTKVTHSVDDGETVRRRRECLSCNGRFTTFEIIAPRPDADERMNRAARAAKRGVDLGARVALHAIRKDVDDDQLPLL